MKGGFGAFVIRSLMLMVSSICSYQPAGIVQLVLVRVWCVVSWAGALSVWCRRRAIRGVTYGATSRRCQEPLAEFTA